MNGSRTPLEYRHRVASRIAIAMAATIPVYILVGELIRRSTPSTLPVLSPEYHGTVRNVVFIAGVICVLIARLIKSLLLMKRPDMPASTGEAVAEQLLGRLMVAFIISYGFAEFPALLGLISFILTRQSQPFYLLILVSVYLFAVHAPRFAQWQSWFTNQMRDLGNMNK